MLKTSTLRTTLIAIACATTFAASASDAGRIEVPAGDLVAALESLAKQARVELIYQADQLKDFRTGGARGMLSPQEAITKLLEGTPFRLRTDEATGAMFITLPRNSDAASHSASGERSSDSTDSAGQETRSEAAAEQSRVAQAAASVENRGAGASEKKSSELEELNFTIPEILVRGSRLVNADIRRTENDTQPYVVFGAEEIQQSHAATVEEFLNTRLPMNSLKGVAAQTNGLSFGNTGRVNLRGLGINQTLILLNGRRLPNVNAAAASQPDINSIPVSAIERIEVLPTTASGIYGGGATGGVVNIITRRNYSGVEGGSTIGSTFHGDALNYRMDIGQGMQLEGGRTDLLFAGSYAKSEPLYFGDVDLVERGRALQLANNPGALFAASSPPFGYTSNIRSANGSNLVLRSGNTPLNSPITFVPVGYSGPASDNGAALLANAGQYNLDIPNDISGDRATALGGHREASGFLSVRREFTERVTAFAEASWAENRGENYLAGSLPTTVTLAPTAPNNPFTTSIVVRFPGTGLHYPWLVDNESVRGATGAIVRLSDKWTASADYVWSRSTLHLKATTQPVGDPDGTAGPAVAAADALRNGALDVMRDLNAAPLDWGPYLLPSPNFFTGPYETVMNDANLRLAGSLFDLPGGPLTLTALGEYREEKARSAWDDRVSNALVPTVTYRPERAQSVYSLYLEGRAPLFSASNALPWVRELEFQVSVRRDDYKTDASSPASATLTSRQDPLPAFSQTTNKVDDIAYTLGLRYMPIEDVTLRASLGTGFLPPDINQITPLPLGLTTQSLIDPKRGGVATLVTFDRFTGGDPNLAPEDSKSLSFGAIFTPQFLDGLRLSVDFTRIRKSNEISSISFQQDLDLEDTLHRVLRAPLTQEDIQNGYTAGAILAFNSPMLNIASTEGKAIDVQVDYLWQTEGLGEFNFYAVATHTSEFDRKLLPGDSFTESAGFNDGPLEWRGNVGVTWSRQDWTVGWNAQYYDSYFVYDSTATAATIATAVLNQGGATVPSQTYHDLSARYDFSRGWLTDTVVTFGVQNVLDKHPPALATISATGGYSQYGDPRLRRFSLGVRKKF